ncbi:hypothetical protein [Paramicrobacterium agarici]|uniref:Uncharacterized protein n=1 Tax=Paramicrobacterium agarici TaxID=630514 RepID=A0A2A9DT94_9MICO|nr:hypothetical protein [Microbacterium agarici]PFG29576.1 hypothetical protein ATJ78_0483 [Microbacterium agarici]
MWKFGSIIVLVIGAVVGGAVAAAGYIFVGTLIEVAWFAGGISLDLAVVYALIAAAAGALIGFAASLGAASVVIAQRRSPSARRRVTSATVAAVICGVSVPAVAFGVLGTLQQNVVVVGVCALLIAVLASVGLSASERRQRRRHS